MPVIIPRKVPERMITNGYSLRWLEEYDIFLESCIFPEVVQRPTKNKHQAIPLLISSKWALRERKREIALSAWSVWLWLVSHALLIPEMIPPGGVLVNWSITVSGLADCTFYAGMKFHVTQMWTPSMVPSINRPTIYPLAVFDRLKK